MHTMENVSHLMKSIKKEREINNMTPLAELLRPTNLDQVAGQKHLLAPGTVFRNIAESGRIPNMIFYGPPGIGKSTIAKILANNTNIEICKLNATTAKTEDIRDVIKKGEKSPVLLYLDEIQYFNKKQQQTLLECTEDGTVTLISSTTENPYFYVYKAILSRSTVFEFKPLTFDDVITAIRLALHRFNNGLNIEFGVSELIKIEDDTIDFIAKTCGGDVRSALNTIESAILAEKNSALTKQTCLIEIKDDIIEQIAKSKGGIRYDRDGDEHYDILSAYQKSLRGSDPNAALHYLARLLVAGDLLSACRRLMVCVCEDVGLANPNIIPMVKACCDIAVQVGLPEAKIPLSTAVLLVANSPKSISACNAIGEAIHDVENLTGLEIPDHLKDSHYASAKKLGRGVNYLYPHDYTDNWVSQQYLPDTLIDKQYYVPGQNFNEHKNTEFWKEVKNSSFISEFLNT